MTLDAQKALSDAVADCRTAAAERCQAPGGAGRRARNSCTIATNEDGWSTQGKCPTRTFTELGLPQEQARHHATASCAIYLGTATLHRVSAAPDDSEAYVNSITSALVRT